MTHAVHFELRSRVAYVTLAAPDTGNVLNTPVIEAIHRHVVDAIADASCRVIVVRSTGADFCRGMDFGWVNGDPADLRAMGRAFGACLSAINASPKPVIACLEGNVAGGGVGLASACDVVLAKEHITFTLPEVIIGMIPALITPFLLRRIGAGRVRYMAISSRAVPAPEAARYGLVDELVTGELREALQRQLKRLLCSSPAALAEMKLSLARIEGDRLQGEIDAALAQLDRWLDQENAIEGVRTFAEGFTPSWFEKYRDLA